jgi:hypothetical protein
MADHFVIDGSNLATEGRTEPSLAQLREAVAAFQGEHPEAMVTVVVDASFEHRIDPSERPAFSKAEIANEVVSPPAGAVGRGDGFLLQIANRTSATVVSNDSFQEFHAEYEWLFEPGRLIGGKPVPGVGWIFSLRRPVRGIVSRKTTQRAKREERAAKEVQAAIAEATADALTNETGRRRRRRGGRSTKSAEATAEPEAVNEPAPFLQFVIDHRLGTDVDGLVDAFASHGAFVVVDGVRCYVPLGAMGDPRPTRARDVLRRGETRTFVVQAVDAPRRGVELALPGFAKVAGAPSDETVEAELTRSRPRKAAGGARPKDTKPKDAKPKAKDTKPKAKDGKPKDAKKGTKGTPAATKTGKAAKATTSKPAKQPAPAKSAPKQSAANQPAPPKPAPKQAARKAPATKTPAGTTTKRATAAQPDARGRARGVGGEKVSGAKKTRAARSTTKAAARPPSQQGPTTKGATKQVTAGQPTKQATAKQATAKQATAKQATAKQATAKQAAGKKATAKKATAARTTATRATKQKGNR